MYDNKVIRSIINLTKMIQFNLNCLFIYTLSVDASLKLYIHTFESIAFENLEVD
jgi:hypothetical protein